MNKLFLLMNGNGDFYLNLLSEAFKNVNNNNNNSNSDRLLGKKISTAEVCNH